MNESDSARELLLAQQKVTTLRHALTQLSGLLSSTSDALAQSQSDFSALSAAHQSAIKGVVEDRDGLRVLVGVWEGRWREERRTREQAEKIVLERIPTSTQTTRNDRDKRAETVLRLEPLASRQRRTTPTRRRRHSSSASSSSSTASATSHSTHLTTSQAVDGTVTSFSSHTTTIAGQRVKSRDVISGLAKELERTRREGNRLLQERDDEISRLESDATARKKELEGLYNTFDQLAILQHFEAPSQSVDKPQDTVSRGSQRPSSHPEHPSIVDRLMLQHPSGSRTDRTSGLEADVRALEAEAHRRGLLRVPEASLEAFALPDHRMNGGDVDRARQSGVMRELNEEIARLRVALGEVQRERDVLQRLSHDRGQISEENSENSLADRDQLTSLLSQSEAQVAQLSHRLAEAQGTIEGVSERVRSKLQEQRDKLAAAYERIAELEAEHPYV